MDRHHLWREILLKKLVSENVVARVPDRLPFEILLARERKTDELGRAKDHLSSWVLFVDTIGRL